MRFLDVFLLHCLLAESPPDSPQEIAVIAQNQYRVAERGREPGLRLRRGSEEIDLAQWGAELVRECAPIADALDRAQGCRAHADALTSAASMLREPDRTPSARVLREMRARGDSYVDFALAQSLRHREALLGLPLADAVERRIAQMAEESLLAQRRIDGVGDARKILGAQVGVKENRLHPVHGALGLGQRRAGAGNQQLDSAREWIGGGADCERRHFLPQDLLELVVRNGAPLFDDADRPEDGAERRNVDEHLFRHSVQGEGQAQMRAGHVVERGDDEIPVPRQRADAILQRVIESERRILEKAGQLDRAGRLVDLGRLGVVLLLVPRERFRIGGDAETSAQIFRVFRDSHPTLLLAPRQHLRIGSGQDHIRFLEQSPALHQLGPRVARLGEHRLRMFRLVQESKIATESSVP